MRGEGCRGGLRGCSLCVSLAALGHRQSGANMNYPANATKLLTILTTNYMDQGYSKETNLAWCEYLLQGNLILRMGHAPRGLSHEEELKFTPETIDWNITYKNVTNIAQLYLQSLEPVRILLLGYIETGKDSYLTLGRAIIQSWLDFDARLESKTNESIWYDHCVSERTQILMLFVLLAEQAGAEDDGSTRLHVKERLKLHVDYLSSDENFVTQNHGVMIDKALSLASHFDVDNVNAAARRMKSLSRLRESFRRDFSENMVNLENSASYHDFNLGLFLGIEYGILRPLGDTLDSEVRASFDKAIDFMVHASQPNKRLPFWGAGAKVNLESLAKRNSYALFKDHSALSYVLSDGKDGVMPTELVKAYEREGYVFMRSRWQTDSDPDPTYASFKAGFRAPQPQAR